MAVGKKYREKSEIYWWYFQVAAVLTLVSLVIWRTLIPSSPTFTIAGFHVLPSDTKNSTTTDHHNSTSIRLGIEILNPNKGMNIYYSDIYFTMNYNNGIVVAKNSTPGFYQPCKNDTMRAVEMKADLQFLQQIITGGNVSFKIGLETTVQYMYRIFKWKTKHHKMDYEAYLYNVTVSLNGTDLGQNGTVLKKKF